MRDILQVSLICQDKQNSTSLTHGGGICKYELFYNALLFKMASDHLKPVQKQQGGDEISGGRRFKGHLNSPLTVKCVWRRD